jgi:hypothetical protein
MSHNLLTEQDLITIANQVCLYGFKISIIGDIGNEEQVRTLSTLLFDRNCSVVSDYHEVLTLQDIDNDQLPTHMDSYNNVEAWAHACVMLTDFTYMDLNNFNSGQNSCIIFSFNKSIRATEGTHIGNCHMEWDGKTFVRSDHFKGMQSVVMDNDILKEQQDWPNRIQSMYPETRLKSFDHVLPLAAIPAEGHSVQLYWRPEAYNVIVNEIKRTNATHIAWLALDEGLQAPFVSNAQVLSDMLVRDGHIANTNVLYFTADECALELYEALTKYTKPHVKMKMCSCRTFEHNSWKMNQHITLYPPDPDSGTLIPREIGERSQEQQQYIENAMVFDPAPKPLQFLSFNRMPRGPRVGVLAELIRVGQIDQGLYSLHWDQELKEEIEYLFRIAKEEIEHAITDYPVLAGDNLFRADWDMMKLNNFVFQAPEEFESVVAIRHKFELLLDFFNNRDNKRLVIDSETVMQDNPVTSDLSHSEYYAQTNYSIVHESMFYADEGQTGERIDMNRARSNSQGRWTSTMYGCFGGNFFSEKIFKPIVFMHPFILVGRPNSLKLLRDSGYQTFDGIFDETYDTIENDIDRLNAVESEITRLNSLASGKWATMLPKIKSIVEHNYKHYISSRRLAVYPNDLNKYIT